MTRLCFFRSLLRFVCFMAMKCCMREITVLKFFTIHNYLRAGKSMKNSFFERMKNPRHNLCFKLLFYCEIYLFNNKRDLKRFLHLELLSRCKLISLCAFHLNIAQWNFRSHFKEFFFPTLQ